jgi:hypothetical protein
VVVAIRVGDKFMLKCGIEVEVTDYVSAQNVTVIDATGKAKVTTSVQLRNGYVGWNTENKRYKRSDSVTTGFYVYAVRYKENIVYIGKGVGNRIEHVNSGISHCYQLNKLHFLGETVETELLSENLTEKQALAIEEMLINIQYPEYNITLKK